MTTFPKNKKLLSLKRIDNITHKVYVNKMFVYTLILRIMFNPHVGIYRLNCVKLDYT